MDLDNWYIENLVCPRDHSKFKFINNILYCEKGCSYPVIEGVPVLLLEESVNTFEVAKYSLKRARGEYIDTRAKELYFESLGISEEDKVLILQNKDKSKIDPVVNFLVGATCGILYRKLMGRLNRYPIPHLYLKNTEGSFLDIGCGWGRWSIAACRLGYQVIGIDLSLGAIMAARRLNNELCLNIKYLVADARYLPFPDDYFNIVFSYSVIQHFKKEDLILSLKEIKRTLKDNGSTYIQMNNKFGLRSIYHQIKRGFKEPKGFGVRYYSPYELKKIFSQIIGKIYFEADCYFTLGLNRNDKDLFPFITKIVIYLSEFFKKISKIFYPLIYIADSLWVISIKQGL